MPPRQSNDVDDAVRAGAGQGLIGFGRIHSRVAPTLPNVTIVTTCKGRLAFLRQTLPQMVNTGLPVTVVDFDCPEGTAAFVVAAHPSVRVIAVRDQPIWVQTIACNIGAQNSTSDFLLFLDSDIILHNGFKDFLLSRKLRDDEFFVGSGNPELFGQCLIPRPRFDDIGGYDEAIVGWGYHDNDIYERLKLKGARQLGFPPGLLQALPHSDELRTQFNTETKKWSNQRINSIYSHIKIDLESINHSPLTLETRRQLRKKIKMIIGEAAVAHPKPITLEISRGKLGIIGPDEIIREGGYELDRALKFILSSNTARQ